MSHEIQFGFSVPVFASGQSGLFRTPGWVKMNPQLALNLGQLADVLGFDSLWVADHLMLGEGDAILEGWTTLSALASTTHRAKLGLIHQAHPLRHPALVAKMIATIDQISQGRFIYFADYGRNAQEYRAYGIPWADESRDRIKQMLEGVRLMQALWQADGRLDYQGEFYCLSAARCVPKPWRRASPPIWFGEAEREILQNTAEFAQGWNSVPVTRAELATRLQALEKACQECGRDYEELEKSLELQILIGADRDGVRQTLRTIGKSFDEAVRGTDWYQWAVRNDCDDFSESSLDLRLGLFGTPRQIIDQLVDLVSMGITHFLLWFLDAPSTNGMTMFMDEVAPAFR